LFDDRRDSSDTHRDDGAAGQQCLDEHAGHAFGRARRDEDVDPAEHGRYVATLAEHVHERRERACRDVVLELLSEGSVARNDEMRRLSPRAGSGNHVEDAFRTLLLDEMSDEADDRRVVRNPQLDAERACRCGPIESDEGFRVAKVLDGPDRGSEAEPAQLRLELVGQDNGRVAAASEACPPHAARQTPHRRGKGKDPLPDDQRRGPAPGAHRDLERGTAVREHDVGRVTLEVAAQRAAQRIPG
jgi:hypothetical protein